MSGHSKWSTIKRKKAANDAKRGKVFTQLIREITMAARMGGGDVDSNPRLRLAIERARSTNMPKDNIERAVAKGAGSGEGEDYEEIRYEGYGPGGVAVIIDSLTDNRNRTVSEVRHFFSKYGGNLGSSGCVAYLFDKRGILEFDRAGLDVDALMEAALEAGCDDVVEDDDVVRVETGPDAFDAVRAAVDAKGYAPAVAEIQMVPQTTVSLSGKGAETMMKLWEALDEHEDVKNVYANFDIPEEELMAAVAGA